MKVIACGRQTPGGGLQRITLSQQSPSWVCDAAGGHGSHQGEGHQAETLWKNEGFVFSEALHQLQPLLPLQTPSTGEEGCALHQKSSWPFHVSKNFVGPKCSFQELPFGVCTDPAPLSGWALNAGIKANLQ